MIVVAVYICLRKERHVLLSKGIGVGYIATKKAKEIIASTWNMAEYHLLWFLASISLFSHLIWLIW